MREKEQKDTSIKILNGSGITVNDEQEVVKEVERFWGNLFCTNGKVTLGQKKEMIGKGYDNLQMKSGVIAEYLKALDSRRSRETKRLDEWNIEWSRYPERVEKD